MERSGTGASSLPGSDGPLDALEDVPVPLAPAGWQFCPVADIPRLRVNEVTEPLRRA